MRNTLVVVAAIAVLVALAAGYFWTGRHGSPRSLARPEPTAAADAASPGDGASRRAADAAPGGVKPPPPHPLWARDEPAILAEGVADVPTTVDAALSDVLRAVADSGHRTASLSPLTIDYPLNDSLFPPDFLPPTFLWHDETEALDSWLFEFALADNAARICVLAVGEPPPAGEIDPRCITDTNEVYQPTAYQASARAWTPSSAVWEAIKRRSVDQPARVTLWGFASAAPHEARSQGQLRIATARDPVAAPIFYRDVPLAPSKTQEGVIKPLSEASLPLIAWRLRDVSRPDSRLLVTDLLTCTNCHSFSADGRTLGMDLDGPANDKGVYVIAPVAKRTVIESQHVISWNAYPNKLPGHKTLGFLSRISPDGEHVMTTLNESVYVYNFTDYRFLQVFFPTRGILAYYRRATGEIQALPGADDPQYVHCDPVWSPDGTYLVFARAQARDPYPEGYTPAQYANDPAETQIQYDLYRIPFNGGRGGQAEPIRGASANGMSNHFPKISPDGKWIVFVQCRNGQLMRPDSKLWIVPAAGGEARQMRANTPRMNSWHSFSPNSRWLVFSSKANTPYTQMFLTHIDDDGNDTPALLIPNATAANRAVNLPEFVNVPYDEFERIEMPVVQYLNEGMKGIRLFEQGQLDAALAQFRIAVQAQPDYVEGQVSIAVILIEKGRFDEALPHLERALKLDPDSWFAHANLGIVLERKGRRDQALEHFVKSVELNPRHPLARGNLGRALAREGRFDEAEFHFRVAVELVPEDPGSRLNLGNVQLERGELADACEHFEKALQGNPRLLAARRGLGEALAQRGEFAAAIQQFRQAASLAPNDIATLNSLAWLLATCPQDAWRDGPAAVKLAATACQLTGYQDPLLLRTLAAAYAAAGQWSEAVHTATQALDQLAQQPETPLAQDLRQQREEYRRGRALRAERP